MTDRLDGPQATGGGESAAGASSGPRETPADPSTDSPQPGAALSDSGADAPATSDSLTVSESPTDDSPIDSDEPPAGPAAAGYATAAPPGAVATAVATAGATQAAPRLGPSPRLAVMFLLPALLLLAAWVIYPIVYSIWRSLYDSAGDRFVGLGNYLSIFTDSSTLTTIRNNIIWVVVAPIIVTALGLIFAVLTERIRWSTAFKLVLFMPMAVSLLAAGVIFRLVYEQDPDKGVANAIITSVHDAFSSSASYPGARPRENDQAPAVAQGGAVVTKQQVQAGTPVLIPLVGLNHDTVKDAPAAKAAPGGDGLSGTVWLDVVRGGGGTLNQIDPQEKGLGGITVEAVSGGAVKATTETAADGTFRFSGLPAGSYVVRLPQSNFTAPFNGLTWLGPALITPAIIGAYIWVWAGFAMVLIAAGLSAIPRDALEAARIDGATEWQVFRRITVPLLSPVLLVVFVTMIINVLKVFDLVFIIAPGSVQPQANVIALEMWRVSFGGGGNQGLGSALSIFLLVLVVPFMIFNIRRFRRDEG
ncbi:multiple sugar transport system permease protein/alpha-glucoside transport system permease protein [Microbispora rosea]|uniref:Multiple sugar transport system permease protein/alpha-glucoside transport system permease protein n=1 Tax=Microbispora rosea TaxID=58117 RepID=A0A1N7A5G2_9ACTN|nr:ABC transporter permease subunit [Microbispora rosea]GIH48228.1 ABC transporter permease [Microbispora rosea subsp. rosea]SIR34334.1 multiple sugar transport system permease protein/alpha-glucoside transport system permease protein [Microbispora rosea]